MITEKVYIETQLETLTTFGVRLDTGEQVFIPSKIVKKHNILEEQTRELVILPNAHSSDSTPWRAVGVSISDTCETPRDVDPTPRVQLAKLEDRVMDYFSEDEDKQYPHSAPALADALGVDGLHMQQTLSHMHNAGEMAKAQVFAKGTQDKASVVLWAPDILWFSA
jgi:hypothetical protein|tara:strand:+ start:66 stop:563 length:498 start_codon:yes stop_codon:yes gene_type:complete